jgi:hypothetical protein
MSHCCPYLRQFDAIFSLDSAFSPWHGICFIQVVALNDAQKQRKEK